LTLRTATARHATVVRAFWRDKRFPGDRWLEKAGSAITASNNNDIPPARIRINAREEPSMASKKKQAAFKPSAAGTTVNLLLQYSGGLNFKKAMVNGVQMVFSGGVSRFSISVKGDHRLLWEVAGFVGAKWSYKLISETEGYVVSPKKLSDPGRSFELKQPFEKLPVMNFTIEAAEAAK